MNKTSQPAPVTRPDPVLPRWPLFLLVSGFCVLFALVGILGQLWALAVGWLVLMTAVHVAANVWGTRLRHVRRATAIDDDAVASAWRADYSAAVTFAPTTRLRERHALSWLRAIMSVLLAVIAGVAGTTGLWLLTWGSMDYGSLAIAGVSAAVIGGFLGFLMSSFMEVGLRAWWEAQKTAGGGTNRAPPKERAIVGE
jgi:hypothetical protein